MSKRSQSVRERLLAVFTRLPAWVQAALVGAWSATGDLAWRALRYYGAHDVADQDERRPTQLRRAGLAAFVLLLWAGPGALLIQWTARWRYLPLLIVIIAVARGVLRGWALWERLRGPNTDKPVVASRRSETADSHVGDLSNVDVDDIPDDLRELTRNPDVPVTDTELTSAFVHAGIFRAAECLRLDGDAERIADGWRASIILPRGMTGANVRTKIDRLASALDTVPQHLDITDGTSLRRITLTWYRRLPHTGLPVRHPLLDGSQGDIRANGHPFGLDVDGQLVTIDLVRGRHGLIVASSQNGKTNHCRNLIITCLADSTAEVVVLDGKPDGKYDVFAGALAGHVDTSMEGWEALSVKLLEDEVRLAQERQQLIRAGRTVGYRLVIVDEFQVFTGSSATGGMSAGSPRQRRRAALTTLSRLGAASQNMIVLASQSYDGRIIDAETLNNVGWRIIGFAPSKMSRAALGEHADQHGLDTSQMLIDVRQAGAAVVTSPGIERYAVARGWFQSDAAISVAVHRVLAERGGGQQVSEELRNLLRACLAEYTDTDDVWVTKERLREKIGVGRLGWPDDNGTVTQGAMRLARLLDEAGVVTERPEALGRRRAVSVIELLAAARRVVTDRDEVRSG